MIRYYIDMNQGETVLCLEHNIPARIFWSTRNKDWYAICDANVINTKNGQVGKGHFVKTNDDLEFDRGYRNQYDPDYQTNSQHETT